MPELYVDGTWVTASSGGRRTICCPADGSLVGEVDEATAADTESAVAAAYRAFHEGPWRATSALERGDLLLRTADLLERDADEVALAESRDTGKRLVESRYDVADVVSVFRYYGRVAAEDAGRVVDTGNPDVVSRIVHEPVGVCGLIAPWNYPLLQASWKVAPCLAAGNTFVLKPSELTPHTSIHLMRLLEEAGLPAGVGNLVLGAGAQAGAPLATDPRVDLVSFTGGLVTGRAVMASASATVKKVALELGGKNPNIVFADADLDVALDYALTAVFLHSGQVCSAGARLLVDESVHDALVDALVERAQAIRLGGPFDDKAETGPLISAAHREKVAAYVAKGVAEGALLRCGGSAPDDPALADGFYYLPTVLDGCTSDMSVTQDESFGPVLTVETFRDEDEAVAIANDSIFGLAGAVWTQDAGKAQRVANRLRMGTVWINDYHPYVPQAEWGGYKQSGFGRELGEHGLAEYRETKHVWHNIRPGVQHWFEDTTGTSLTGRADRP
jgi:betaine-aldehyde dehydrogenase